jgi:tRNA A-37 threonylcarbamoyl transferase component Bud32
MNSSSPQNPQSLIGSTIAGNYVLDRLLGQGRHGFLFDAHHARLGSRSAVRLIRADTQRRSALIAALSQHGAVVHPHLNPPLDIVTLPDDQILIASPLLPGLDLNQRVAARGKLTASEGVVMLRQTAAALHALHQKGICHGNLTASNVFFAQFDDVSVDNALGDSKGSHIVQLIDPALGLLEGTSANAGDDQRSLGRIMLAFVADLTPAQRQVLERAQDTRTEGRFASIAELFRAFEQAEGRGGRRAGAGKEDKAEGSGGRSVATAVVAKIDLSAQRGMPRQRLVLIVAVAVGLALIVLVAALSGRHTPPPPAAVTLPAPPPPSPPLEVKEQKPDDAAVQAPPADDSADAQKGKKKKKRHRPATF